MAIKLNDYKSIPNSTNIKIHKKNIRKFLFRFKMKVWDAKKGDYAYKQFAKIFTVYARDHSRRDNVRLAQTAFLNFKESVERQADGKTDNDITLDKLFVLYMDTQPNTDWTHKKQHVYDLYIGNSGLKSTERKSTRDFKKIHAIYQKHKIGYLKISEIRPMHIEKIISFMEENGLSPRTRKGILEILNPIFKYAIRNKYIKESPSEYIAVKIPSQKKIVTNATELFKKVYIGITTFYQDEPFYKALFLFGFTGRRKSEILNLIWENIDIDGDYYWIEDTKNGEKQRYPLPAMIKAALLEIKEDQTGTVFKSPVTGKKIVNIDRQMKKLKEYIGIDNLTLHYMRNILVSALAEQSTEAVTLSGILGHKDINTINKYLSNSTMKSGLKGLKAIDGILDKRVSINCNLKHNS